MATFDELLEYNADQLEALTDEQLYEYLKPCLVDCPPIDQKIVQDEENKIKAEKLVKKLEERAKKKEERDKLKAEKLANKEPQLKQASAKKLNVMADMAKVLQEQINRQLKKN